MNREIVLYDVNYKKVSYCSKLMKVSYNTGNSKNRTSNKLNVCLSNPFIDKFISVARDKYSAEYLYKQKYHIQNLLLL